MNLDDALKIFVTESRELLGEMEAALLKVEQSPNDPDLINAIFRAAHTIKGSAGLFGLDHLVEFTHNAENILDQVRAGKLPITGELVILLLAFCDHASTLIDFIDQGQDVPPQVAERSKELISKMEIGSHKSAEKFEICEIENPSHSVATENWHLSLHFGREVLRNGMDPASFIRYLATMGRIVRIVTLTKNIPEGENLDPEDCYLAFEISYQTEADKNTIEGAFEFVRDDAIINIIPPKSSRREYLKLIQNSPSPIDVSENLVRCGTLTPEELELVFDEKLEKNIQEATPVPKSETSVAANRPDEKIPETKEKKESKSNDYSLIRVNSANLDSHINLIGELITASSSLSISALKSGVPELLESASVMARLVESIRDSALQLRMVQIGATFNKFQRVVHDVSKETGKDINLIISGSETELDKNIIEKIGDPLLHLIRNSIDHGIESAEVRAANGKPSQGTLSLNAYHECGSIVIEVSDDGGGLNKKRILAKAIERGLIKPDQTLNDNEIQNLIFEPGFSTSEKVNNLSGRGVGMDVVRRNISALRGTIEIESTETVGTSMRIRLPLTLAIIDGFLVGVGDSAFVVPLDMVEECVQLTQHEIDESQGRDHINLRGKVLPFIRLKDIFNVPDRPIKEFEFDPELNIDPEFAFLLQPTQRDNVVIVNFAGNRVGLVVDELQGEYQTVIRPLGKVFNGLKGLSGFTILGTGRVALIIDVPSLVMRIVNGCVFH
ncbi:MAG: chemotaxis protein CheA [Burkholderiaceae bacterium]|nr:chemotaxis protein CheA [Burkholderiaceae bacterium]